MNSSLEIIFHDEIQWIFDRFASSFGIAIIFYSIGGKILRRGQNRPPSPFCKLVQDRLEGRMLCTEIDEEMCRRCTRSEKPVSYRCHAGIEEAVAPLYVNGQLIGYAMIGQFRTTDNIDPAILPKAQKYGVEKELCIAFSHLPCFSREQADNILGLFSTLMDYILIKELVSVKGGRIIGRVLVYIEEHLSQKIGIRDAAQSVGQSISTVSHQLKHTTGKTFTQHLNEARVQRAEEHIRQSPECSIQEISEQVGYSDPFYFSRVYRQHRGMSPSRFRATLSAQEE